MPHHRILRASMALALLLASGIARAHGTLPTANGIAFGATGGTLYGTNFGGLWQAVAGGSTLFVCETLVTGEPRSLDAWIWLGSGRVVAATTSGGFAFGVFAASDASACNFATVAGTEDLTVTEVIADPDDATAFLACGRNDPVAAAHAGRIVHGTPDAIRVVYDRPGFTVTGVRARGGHLYASASSSTTIGESLLVHSADAGAHWDEWPQGLAAGEAILPLGVSRADPLTMWLVRQSDAGDRLLRTTDGGAHFVDVLTVDGPLAAFAQSEDGATVWVQSPTRAVYRSGDGGSTFEGLAGSPHGACLTFHDGQLFACGVPWQDGLTWGVAADGRTFAPLAVGFDDIAGPVACPTRPEATEMCRKELEFLRGYFGFATPPAPDGIGEGAPEVMGDSEGAGDAEAAAATETARGEPVAGAADGCGGGALSDGGAASIAVAGLVLARAFSARRRPRRAR